MPPPRQGHQPDGPEGLPDAGALVAALMASSRDAIIVHDLEGTITVWSDGATQVFGWERQDMLGRAIVRILPPELREEASRLAIQAAAGEPVQEVLTRRIRRDQRVVDVLSTLAPMWDAEGEVSAIVRIERDVTRRRRVDAIVEGQRQMLVTLERTGSLKDGLLELLDALRSLTAGDVDPCIMTVGAERHLLHPEASRLPARLHERLAHGVPIAPGGHPAGEAAFRGQAVSVPHALGRQVAPVVQELVSDTPFKSICSTPILGPAGEALGTLDLYSHDVGDPRPEDLDVVASMSRIAALAIERFRTLEELTSGRRVLQALNEITGVLSVELEHDRIAERVAEEATRLLGADMGVFFHRPRAGEGLGFAARNLAGPLGAAFQGMDLPQATLLLGQIRDGAAVLRFDDVTRDPRYGKTGPHYGAPAGHPPVRSFLATTVRSRGGGVLGMLLFGHRTAGRFSRSDEAILRGVASQTAISLDNAWLYREAQERAASYADADRRKDEFLAMLGHELRGPLGAMIASVSYLQGREDRDADDRRAVEVLDRQMQQMRRLVDDLLDVSRISRGKIALRRTVLDLRQVLQETCEAAQGMVDAADQRLACEVPTDPVWVYGDALRLQQAIGNLLDNAVKFSEAGALTRCTLDVEGDDARVRVVDQGQGIPLESLPDIFDLFVQADSSDTSLGGLGLGLTLVQALARLHQGSVSAHSQGVGHGSTFEIRLRRKDAPREDVQKGVARTEQAGEGMAWEDRPLRILLAEDQEDAAVALGLLLRSWGHELVHVTQGAEALDRVRAETFDVALLDIGLPEMDGWTLMQRIRHVRRLRTLPVAALTGRGQGEDKERSHEAGFDRHFVKPVEPLQLRQWLDAVSRRSPHEGQA